MESDELYIKTRFGKEQSFTVPSGYFESLSGRISEQLPSDVASVSVVTPWRRYRAAIAAAACLCLMAVGATAYFATESPKTTIVASHSAMHESISESSIDCVADYTMLDNEDIYALVSNY